MADNKKNRRRSADEILKMKAFYEAGETFLEVGARFGISPSRVEQIFRRNGIKARKTTVSKKFRRAMDNRRIILSREALIELYAGEKLPIIKVAERLGVGSHSVRRNLHDYGIPIRPQGDYHSLRLTAELLKTLYIDQNLMAAEIAERLGYAVGTIGKKLSLLGIKKRQGGLSGSLQPPEAAGQSSLTDSSSTDSSSTDSSRNTSAAGSAELPVASPASPEVLTLVEVAGRYKMHPRTLRRMIPKGVFPNAFRPSVGKGRCWMIPAADLENFTPRKKGGLRIEKPTAAAIVSRGRNAGNRIKLSHGYGKAEIQAMIELERQGLTRAGIAVCYRLAERLVADVLNRAALGKPRRRIAPPVEKQLKRLPEQELIGLYVKGKFSTAYILKKLNTNYAALYSNLRHYGIPLRDESRRLLAKEKEATLCRLFFEENLDPQTIADRLKLTVAYVHRKINEIKRRTDQDKG